MSSSKTILFLVEELNVRGMAKAVYDYAQYNEEILGHRSLVMFNQSLNHDPGVAQKFAARFTMAGVDNPQEIDAAVRRLKPDLFYVLKQGRQDPWLTREAPNAVHAVFPTWPDEAHGSAYAYISRWLSHYCARDRAPWVPHIVTPLPLNSDFRADWGIPHDALVLGCYGGNQSFDMDFVKQTLIKAVETRRDLWLVFMNIDRFVEHERILFVPASSDPEVKGRFINSCDAMIHGRERGETFGLSVAEFSISNRPVITYGKSIERAHIETLGSKAILYNDAKDLEQIIAGFDRNWAQRRNWDCYSLDFSPQRVMAQFADVFIDSPVDPATWSQTPWWPQELTPLALKRTLRLASRRLRSDKARAVGK